MTKRPNFIDWQAIYSDVDQKKIFKMDNQAEIWLNNATTEFKFDKEDALVGFVDTLKQVGWHVLGKGGSDCGDDALGKTIEEIRKLLELSAQNVINMCRMGGMTALLAIMVKHPFNTIRH